MSIVCPEASLTLLDSNGKKMTVVEDIRKSLKLENVKVVNKRAEDHNESYDFMMGRAVSAMPKFLSFSSHFLEADGNGNPACQKPGSGLYYLKGGMEGISQEMSEAQIRKEAEVFALDWERTVSTLPWQHVVIFRKRH
jgi:16S rRNA (guanine527-N7)-methyltransferase